MKLEWNLALQLIPIELWNTLYMVVAATFFATLLGLPLGIILTITRRGHIHESPLIHKVLGSIVNVGRSFPFAILIVAIIPFTRWITGTSLGTTAAIVPLSIAAAPFFARLVESALNHVSKEIVESAIVMGSTVRQIIFRVLLPEAMPGLILALTMTAINLIGYSAMAGMVGGGGLGKIAIQYGYYRFDTFLMVVTVALMIALVQAVQWYGNYLFHRLECKRGLRRHD